MSADMKAATEIAERNRYANTTFGDLSNAFLELAEESRRWENVFDAQTSELRGLRQQVEQERKASQFHFDRWQESSTRAMELMDAVEKERALAESAEQHAAESAIAYQAAVNECKLANRRVAELQARLDRVEVALLNAKLSHYVCEDCWYSCPKSEEGCCNENEGEECNCGADKHNALIDAALAAAGGQESAADKLNAIISDGNTLDCKPPFSFNSDGVLNATDPALLTEKDEDGHCTICGLPWPNERDTLEPHECPPGFRAEIAKRTK